MRIAYLTSLLLVLPFAAACSSEAAQAKGHGGSGQTSDDPLRPPLGLEKVDLVAADGNELTLAKAELGKQLFFDPRLSQSGKMGCVGCHYAEQAFTDGKQFSSKDDGKANTRNSPTMYNVGYYPDLYWDGRKHGLEANIQAAWTGQLGGKPDEVARRLNAVPAYKEAFQKAFQKEADENTIVQALASFLRTLRSGNSAYDRFVAGDSKALSEQAQQGLTLFQGKAACIVCHTPPLFSDKLFHNVGIGMQAENPDTGRAKATKAEADTGKFKTPTLREAARTAPYFHDGSVATLREAVKIMATGGHDNPHKDPLLADRGLTDAEIDQLVAFVESLNGDVPFTAPTLPK